ncbi:lactate/malate dehydrogenase, alpha/beta C-terminal domain protein [Mycobacterium xenopi 4042]|uniref:Lactate/malate dehydrogenase, alpha/beta C-terminal domain protein n=1 Tax=Mycobacterium xenopi 4042 TaxID=1299334 RepID=X8DXK7_MYCXE|nr:lactate/malate dehydrogenase, alpha/beta C-terminal domain protein [Mycobacterium xenopi 4042]
MNNAPDIPRERFSALTRLDHNRAIAQLAKKTGAAVTDIKKMTIWGNHSTTQYPDIFHAEIAGKNAAEVVGDQAWIENDFIPTVAKRGAAIIEAAALPRPPRRRRRRSTLPATGCSAPLTATGCRWRWSPTAPTTCRRAWCRRFR